MLIQCVRGICDDALVHRSPNGLQKANDLAGDLDYPHQTSFIFDGEDTNELTFYRKTGTDLQTVSGFCGDSPVYGSSALHVLNVYVSAKVQQQAYCHVIAVMASTM